MKHIPALAALLLCLTACGAMTYGEYDSIHYDLQGTWESYDKSIYSGTLVIEYNKMTITGYSEGQVPAQGGNAAQLPFSGFSKGVPLTAYTEGHTRGNTARAVFYIMNRGTSVPVEYVYTKYTTSSYSYIERLVFTFAGREEELEKQASTPDY